MTFSIESEPSTSRVIVLPVSVFTKICIRPPPRLLVEPSCFFKPLLPWIKPAPKRSRRRRRGKAR